jgi:hypothetical protein
MQDLGSQRQNDVHGNQIVMHLHVCGRATGRGRLARGGRYPLNDGCWI